MKKEEGKNKRRKEEEEFTTEKLEEDTSYLRYAVTEEGETERAFLHTKPKPYESAQKSDSHLFLLFPPFFFQMKAKPYESAPKSDSHLFLFNLENFQINYIILVWRFY